MRYKYYACIIFALPLLFSISCLSARNSTQSMAVKSSIKINYGNAIVKINGKTTENIYYAGIPITAIDNKLYEAPMIANETITKNETRYLSAGDEYAFSVLPSEVVTISIISNDGGDVEIAGYDHGRERIYFLDGHNTIGIVLGFQNR